MPIYPDWIEWAEVSDIRMGTQSYIHVHLSQNIKLLLKLNTQHQHINAKILQKKSDTI